MEIATIAFEYGTWKPSLISKVKKGLESWESETVTLVQKDMDKLEAENIDNISVIAKTYADAFSVDDNPVGNISALQALLEKLDDVEREITA